MQHYTTLTNSEITERISEHIHSAKYREIMRLKLIDGLNKAKSMPSLRLTEKVQRYVYR